MGKKTNPNGFRLNIEEKNFSYWYTNKYNYSLLIKEDYYIRNYIIKYFNNIIILDNIYINRIIQKNNNKEYINIIINFLYPQKKEEHIENLNKKDKNNIIIYFNNKIKNLIRLFKNKYNKNYLISINFINNTFDSALLIAKYISNQLEKRVNCKRILNNILNEIKDINIKGIKIKLSGRLDGISRAKSIIKKYKNIPLSTLNTKIDYISYNTYTIYGIIGIKIWIFLN